MLSIVCWATSISLCPQQQQICACVCVSPSPYTPWCELPIQQTHPPRTDVIPCPILSPLLPPSLTLTLTQHGTARDARWRGLLQPYSITSSKQEESADMVNQYLMNHFFCRGSFIRRCCMTIHTYFLSVGIFNGVKILHKEYTVL